MVEGTWPRQVVQRLGGFLAELGAKGAPHHVDERPVLTGRRRFECFLVSGDQSLHFVGQFSVAFRPAEILLRGFDLVDIGRTVRQMQRGGRRLGEHLFLVADVEQMITSFGADRRIEPDGQCRRSRFHLQRREQFALDHSLDRWTESDARSTQHNQKEQLEDETSVSSLALFLRTNRSIGTRRHRSRSNGKTNLGSAPFYPPGKRRGMFPFPLAIAERKTELYLECREEACEIADAYHSKGHSSRPRRLCVLFFDALRKINRSTS